MAVKEPSIQAAILKYLNSVQGCKAYNMHGSRWQGSGRPDIIACYRGRFLAIEVKRTGGKITKLQEYELLTWSYAGAVTAVVTSVEEVREIIKKLDREIEGA